jgi:hypothetical protein
MKKILITTLMVAILASIPFFAEASATTKRTAGIVAASVNAGRPASPQYLYRRRYRRRYLVRRRRHYRRRHYRRLYVRRRYYRRRYYRRRY